MESTSPFHRYLHLLRYSKRRILASIETVKGKHNFWKGPDSTVRWHTESQRPSSRGQCGSVQHQRISYVGHSENFEEPGANTVDHAFTDRPREDIKQGAATNDEIQGSRLIITSTCVALSRKLSDIYWEFLNLKISGKEEHIKSTNILFVFLIKALEYMWQILHFQLQLGENIHLIFQRKMIKLIVKIYITIYDLSIISEN